jgi:hypothetical protein
VRNFAGKIKHHIGALEQIRPVLESLDPERNHSDGSVEVPEVLPPAPATGHTRIDHRNFSAEFVKSNGKITTDKTETARYNGSSATPRPIPRHYASPHPPPGGHHIDERLS